MKAVKTLFFLSQFFLILGCEQIFPKKEIVRFKVENNSKSEVEWVKIFLQDTEDDSFKVLKSKTEVLTIEKITSKSKTEYSTINLKKYSKTGKGFYIIKYKVSNDSDTLQAIGGVRYNNFKCINDISFAGKYYSNCLIQINDSKNISPNASFYLTFL